MGFGYFLNDMTFEICRSDTCKEVYTQLLNARYTFKLNANGGQCIPWTKSLGPLDLGSVKVIFSWTK